MTVSVKIPNRRWYFLLCYVAFCACACSLVVLPVIRPKLMLMYHLNESQIFSYYLFFARGMMLGGIVFGLLVNILNYRTSFIMVWAIQILGLVKLFSLSPIIVSTPAIHQLKAGMLLIGVASGGIISIIHPLIVLVYQNTQQSHTKIMNYLHTSWPLCIMVTYGFATVLSTYHLDWFLLIYFMLFVSSVYFVMAVFLPLPMQMHAHRILISTRIKSMLRPGYVLLLFCMVCSCIVQYSPLTWIALWIEKGLNISPFLFIMYMNTLLIAARLLVGPIIKRISPPVMLMCASILSVISLYMLTFVTDFTLIFFVFGLLVLSVAWYWPTYIAIVADRYALSGGLGMGIMTAIGFYTIAYVVPDFIKLNVVETQQQAFLDLAWFGCFGFVLTVSVFIAFKTQGGYKVLSTYERSL